eukprot:13335117-Alexandrium_andersonii.AAC.1
MRSRSFDEQLATIAKASSSGICPPPGAQDTDFSATLSFFPSGVVCGLRCPSCVLNPKRWV